MHACCRRSNETDKRKGLSPQPEDVVEAIELAIDEAIDAAGYEEHPSARGPSVTWHGEPAADPRNASATPSPFGRPPLPVSQRKRWARDGSSVHMGFGDFHTPTWFGYGTGSSFDWALM